MVPDMVWCLAARNPPQQLAPSHVDCADDAVGRFEQWQTLDGELGTSTLLGGQRRLRWIRKGGTIGNMRGPRRRMDAASSRNARSSPRGRGRHGPAPPPQAPRRRHAPRDDKYDRGSTGVKPGRTADGRTAAWLAEWPSTRSARYEPCPQRSGTTPDRHAGSAVGPPRQSLGHGARERDW